MIAYIPMRWYTIYADGRTERQQKERQENTMTKETYKQIMHTAKSAEILEGIIRVAVCDEEIDCEDFGELVDEKYKIITEEW